MKSPPHAAAQERLDALYRAHAQAVYRCARRRFGPADADDVMCEVFVVAWRRIGEIPEHELAWLLRVTRNVMANHLRAGSRRAALARRVAVASTGALPDHAGDVVGRDAVQRVVGRLSERDQEVVRLLLGEGLSIPELATALGCRPNTASVRARRAKARLARAYEEEAAGNPATVDELREGLWPRREGATA
jgi:RNA polymerase sigma-70 factor (ECF subfamily)